MILYGTVGAFRHSLTQQLLSETSDACRILWKSEMIIHMVKYMGMCKGLQLQSYFSTPEFCRSLHKSSGSFDLIDVSF